MIAYASLNAFALDSRQNPRQGRLQSPKQSGNETCGSIDDVADKIEVCAQPLMDILEGRIKKYPRDINDVNELCQTVSLKRLSKEISLFYCSAQHY